jgi:hypothetical protein
MREDRYQIPLRVSPEMKAWIQASAEHELRSMNAQVVCFLRELMEARTAKQPRA